MIVDGKAIAEDVYAALEKRRMNFGDVRLGILVVGGDSVIEQFVGIKTQVAGRLGVKINRENLVSSADEGKILQAIERLASTSDAIIVQLPLPKGIDIKSVLSAVPPEKDVDALNPTVDEHPVEAPVALAVVEILNRCNVEVIGKKVVVVGAGRLVGVPSARLLEKLGASVSVFTREEGSMDDLKDADIIVCGAGDPGFIKSEHVKDGVVIIDAGTSESEGKVRGDADPAIAQKAAVFTPVPGGVGPVAVAMIFKNLFDLVERSD